MVCLSRPKEGGLVGWASKVMASESQRPSSFPYVFGGRTLLPYAAPPMEQDPSLIDLPLSQMPQFVPVLGMDAMRTLLEKDLRLLTLRDIRERLHAIVAITCAFRHEDKSAYIQSNCAFQATNACCGHLGIEGEAQASAGRTLLLGATGLEIAGLLSRAAATAVRQALHQLFHDLAIADEGASNEYDGVWNTPNKQVLHALRQRLRDEQLTIGEKVLMIRDELLAILGRALGDAHRRMPLPVVA